jgi:GcrA cell cycle regulator
MGARGTTKTVDRERERQAKMARGRPLVDGLWTEGRVEVLRAGWEAGLSCSQIAADINKKHPGAGFSRSAVIGKAYRLLLPGRENASRPEAGRASRTPRAPTVQRAPYQNAGLAFGHSRGPSKPPAPLPVRDDLAPTATIETLTSRVCKWPIGDPRSPDFGFCGRPKRADAEIHAPYCDEHATIAFNGPATPRTETQLAGDAKRRLTMLMKAATARRSA